METTPEDYRSQFKKLFKSLIKKGRFDSFEVFKEVLEVMAIVQRQSVFHQFPQIEKDEKYHELESRYMEFFVPKYGREGLTTIAKMMGVLQIALQEGVYDFLGYIYEEMDLISNSDRQRRGEFFTPESIGRLMTETMVTKSDVEEAMRGEVGYLSIEDPCCGFGRLLISIVRQIQDMGLQPHRSVLLKGTDIAPHCFHATYVQLSLLDVPAVVNLGNSLGSEYYQHWMTPPLMMASLQGSLGSSFRIGTGMFAYRPDMPIDFTVEETVDKIVQVVKKTESEDIKSNSEEPEQPTIFDAPAQREEEVEQEAIVAPFSEPEASPPEVLESQEPEQLNLFDF